MHTLNENVRSLPSYNITSFYFVLLDLPLQVAPQHNGCDGHAGSQYQKFQEDPNRKLREMHEAQVCLIFFLISYNFLRVKPKNK